MSFFLAHEIVRSESDHGLTNSAFVLHGALGSGQNFRGFVRKLVARRPDYQLVLVDLRCHGGSHGAPLPHTLENAARDLSVLSESLTQGNGARTPSVVIGHSLGGKVALEYAQKYGQGLAQVWALDSDPGPQIAGEEHEVARVMTAVRALPAPITKRQQVVTSLLEQGLSRGLATWMTTNIERDGDHYRLTLDLDGIEQLVADYFERDLWPYLESSAETRPECHLVLAENSDRWNEEMRQRAEGLADQGKIALHHVADAGHWLHVDNPAALLTLLERQLA